MNKTEKVQFVIDKLEELYPEIPIPLDHKDPYTLLIAVLLSAQCTDVRVNQITPLLFAKANNPFDMVKMTVEEIKDIIKPCGLSPMKSKGIYGLSKILIEVEEELETAIVHYRKAHEINPTNVLSLANVAGLHLDLKQVEEAGKVFELATDIQEDVPFLQWQLARYKLVVGDIQGAREAKDRIQRMYVDNPEFILLMADIEAAFGNNRLALDNYRRFVREAGELPEVMQKIAMLEREELSK